MGRVVRRWGWWHGAASDNPAVVLGGRHWELLGVGVLRVCPSPFQDPASGVRGPEGAFTAFLCSGRPRGGECLQWYPCQCRRGLASHDHDNRNPHIAADSLWHGKDLAALRHSIVFLPSMPNCSSRFFSGSDKSFGGQVAVHPPNRRGVSSSEPGGRASHPPRRATG